MVRSNRGSCGLSGRRKRDTHNWHKMGNSNWHKMANVHIKKC